MVMFQILDHDSLSFMVSPDENIDFENPLSEDVYAILLERFGFDSFRGSQEKIISKILEGHDSLIVMPTGGGKSLCYQLPALVKIGVTLVISPLLALMKDQVDALQRKGIAATMINSLLSPREQYERIQEMTRGAYRLVYVAPERFRHEAFRNALKSFPPALIAVDEAHCLSQWGHDFRPDYLSIATFLKELDQPQIIALTATATPLVQDDIVHHLSLRNPVRWVTGFERDNLGIHVIPCSGFEDKIRFLRETISKHETGIIYASTRKNVDKISDEFRRLKIRHEKYHAGMTELERRAAQESFISGETSLVIATNAFGMGIDRGDLRFVAHFDIPGSLEAYYQEIGRAGRDGEMSHCFLLYNYADVRVQEFFIQGANPSRETIRELYSYLQSLPQHQTERSHREIHKVIRAEENEMAVETAIGILEKNKVLERFDVELQKHRGIRLLVPDKKFSELPIPFEVLAEKKKRDEAKLEAILRFANSKKCRQRIILEHFGEKSSQNCERCDRCLQHHQPSFRSGTEEEVLIIRKILSGVARASRRQGSEWIATLGAGRILQGLQGRNTQEVRQSRLDQLSTFGLLQDQPEPYLRSLIEALKKSGYLTTTEGRYPLTTLTSEGESVMKGETVPELDWPTLPKISSLKSGSRTASRSSRNSSTPTVDETLALLHQGKTISEIADLRSFNERTIEEHLFQLFLRKPSPLSIDQWVYPDRQNEIKKVASGSFTRLREIKEKLPEDYSYSEIKWTLAAFDLWKEN